MTNELRVSIEGGEQPEIPTDGDIVDRLLAGATLRSFMIPDASIPSNNPEHIESFQLNHILINKDKFVAKTDTVHLTCKPYQVTGPFAFFYANFGNIFFSHSPNTSKITIMSKKRYRVFNWIVKDDFRLVWDSIDDNNSNSVREEIEAGASLRVAFQDLEGVGVFIRCIFLCTLPIRSSLR